MIELIEIEIRLDLLVSLIGFAEFPDLPLPCMSSAVNFHMALVDAEL